MIGRGYDYRGCQNMTRSGKTSQSWSTVPWAGLVPMLMNSDFARDLEEVDMASPEGEQPEIAVNMRTPPPLLLSVFVVCLLCFSTF